MAEYLTQAYDGHGLVKGAGQTGGNMTQQEAIDRAMRQMFGASDPDNANHEAIRAIIGRVYDAGYTAGVNAG